MVVVVVFVVLVSTLEDGSHKSGMLVFMFLRSTTRYKVSFEHSLSTRPKTKHPPILHPPSNH